MSEDLLNNYIMEKKHFFSICIILTISLLVSCKQFNEKRTVIKGFPESIELKGEHIKEINLLQQPQNLRIVDSVLVVINYDGSHFLEYYNKDNFKLLGRYGNKGRGPGEFISLTGNGELFSRIDGEIIINTYDMTRRRMNYINLHESIINESYECKSELLPNNLVNVHRIVFNNDSLMGIIPDMDGVSRFEIYNKRDSTINYVPFIPKLMKNEVHNNNKYYVYNTWSNCVSNTKQYFIASPTGNGQMDFFDFQGGYIKTIHLMDNERLKEAGYPEYVQSMENYNLFVTDIQIEEEKIFLLFTVFQVPSLTAVSKSKIFVFDLDGNPIREYILDKEIRCFAIDLTNQRFLGYSTSDINGFQLYSFDYN